MVTIMEDLGNFYAKETHGICRFREPVTVGLPLEDGVFRDLRSLEVLDDTGCVLPAQWQVLSRWPSGRARWVSVRTIAHCEANTTRCYRIRKVENADTNASENAATGEIDGVELQTGRHELFTACRDMAPNLSQATASLVGVNNKKEVAVAECDDPQIVSTGAISETTQVEGRLGKRKPLRFVAEITKFRFAPLLRVQLTLHNPRRAEHPGGFWDLGDAGSQWWENVNLKIETNFPRERLVYWTEYPGAELKKTGEERWTLNQMSSGARNWQSRVHRTASGDVPWKTRGYTVACDTESSSGNHASPVVTLSSKNASLGIAVEEFWQKFPSSIEVFGSTLHLGIFPKISNILHELQGGEKTTRTIWMRFSDASTGTADLDWVYHPLSVFPSPETTVRSGGLEWQPEQKDHCCARGGTLTEEMLSGSRNFFWKREAIDEYGWRNYGDFWADHEEAYADNEPKPIISHYNNQYDLLQGLLRQFLTTGDSRWRDLALPLAKHLLDIDIYHTHEDRAAYNGGMFWHTSHYVDAGACTHRSYSREMLGKRHPVDGGGPSNEHNYTSGLLLYYHLTGDQRARDAVLSLAEWVIAMDDGHRHLLAPLSRARTGQGSSTASPSYHGPGRGAGNSINALVDAWQLTGDSRYLEKCRELIHRVVHPQENVAALDLKNAELRWSYTVCLQALARYETIVGDMDPETCRYIRASLINYGEWMLENETLYLETPDQLEFPTETWAAQDLRKGTTLMLIARYARGERRRAMHARGEEILQAAWRQLMEFPTRCCTRPAAIVLQQLPIETFLREAYYHENLATTADTGEHSWPEREAFVSQKAEIKANLRSPWGWCKMALLALRPPAWQYAISESFLGRWWRTID